LLQVWRVGQVSATRKVNGRQESEKFMPRCLSVQECPVGNMSFSWMGTRL
jgi:hypothetical protein